MNPLELKNGLNRYFLDGENGRFTKSLLGALGQNDWAAIYRELKKWEDRGLLKILKNPGLAGPDEACIEMVNLIDLKSPIPGWPPRRE